ncbi:hypothetical protein [Amycolatopsis deserti]|uniref:hypothetical protein n=1 Tax=Amycolatopsis deserti TaxID=185696 RepID=UPI001E3B65FF|nr:hypothetical protein [Amycolatopsis deserti]
MTSTRPESVPCLPCREHAHREHRRLAEQIEHLGDAAGAPMSGQAAHRLRDLARRYSG